MILTEKKSGLSFDFPGLENLYKCNGTVLVVQVGLFAPIQTDSRIDFFLSLFRR